MITLVLGLYERDTTPPTATITNPASAGSTLPASPTLTGTITDNPGGSGIRGVAVVIWKQGVGFVYLDGTPTGFWKSFSAVVPGGNPISANWSLSTSLGAGNYKMYVYPYDAQGNYAVGSRVSSSFIIR